MVDPPSVLTTHLTEVVKQNMAELLSYAETQKLLDELPREQQKLVSDLIPSQISVGGVQRVLQALLAERVSIRDLPTILEGIQEACAGQAPRHHGRSSRMCARASRARSATATPAPSGYIPLVTLSPDWEGGVRRSAGRAAGGPAARHGAEPAAEFMQRFRAAFDAAMQSGETPVLLTSGASASMCARSSSASARPRRCWPRPRFSRARASARSARSECCA